MKATELRIGNFVQLSESATLCEIDGIDYLGLDIVTESESTWIEIDQFEGVRLTEDLLKRLGFKYDSICKEWEIESFTIEKLDDKFYYLTWEGEQVSEFFIHVHSLQNLYFAIEGKELKLSL